MRGAGSMLRLGSRRVVSRVTGRQAIERSLRALLIRVARFHQHRAQTSIDRQWSARVMDTLRVLLS